MDASPYKDYILVLLFIKYVSDKYAGVPQLAHSHYFALKGTSDIGDQINKKILTPLAKENKLGELPDFKDAPNSAPARIWSTASPHAEVAVLSRGSKPPSA